MTCLPLASNATMTVMDAPPPTTTAYYREHHQQQQAQQNEQDGGKQMHLSLNTATTSSDQEQQPPPAVITPQSSHRGKKGTIQLWNDSMDDEHDNDDHHGPQQDDDGDDQDCSKRTSSSQEQHIPTVPNFRSMLERIITNPVVLFFTCSLSEEGMTAESDVVVPPHRWLGLFPRKSSARSGYLQKAQERVPKAIVQTMKQFPHQGKIQRLGCAALRDIANDSWKGKHQVVEAGCVETVLKAMRLHKKDAKLQEVACKCLYPLVAGNLTEELIDRGVVASMLVTMEEHSEDEDILPVACDVLLALTDQDPRALESLRLLQGGVLLAKLDHAFRSQPTEISNKAGELLRRLYVGKPTTTS
eukprot:Nitzschia sp. Nitz4//scaffold49_size126201//77739//78812//NITZ4_003649-RA/size126201-processed-gene-0.100-mRNA-1//-1//CDS//3329553170//9272//frame0